ncbi:MAG: hypothetical protein HQL74_00870 [Magnetococcales bacterium]|nr:hypothetical protein [Magnetococcales bacterium]
MQRAINIGNRSRKGGIFANVAVGLSMDKAVEDTEGVSIGTALATQIRLLNQTMRNAKKAITMTQNVARGATIETARALQNTTPLAIKPANDSATYCNRPGINHGVMQLLREINRIAEDFECNGPGYRRKNGTQPITIGSTVSGLIRGGTSRLQSSMRRSIRDTTPGRACQGNRPGEEDTEPASDAITEPPDHRDHIRTGQSRTIEHVK